MLLKKKKQKAEAVEEQPIYNEFGVCIACQGGDSSCHHNNLIEENQKVVCRLCGFVVKE